MHRFVNARIGTAVAAVAMLVASYPSIGRAVEVESFAEPYRSIDVAAAEPGIIRSCEVKEGDIVSEGEVLAQLDHDVQLALLAMGEKSKEFRGRITSAQAELELRRYRLTKLEELHVRGHARQEEVERARADVAIAQGNLLSAQEELMLKGLEYQRIQVQIERRIIRSPLSGVVTAIRRQPGEFVPAVDPHVMTIVQLDSLIATFSVPAVKATNMYVEQQVNVRFPQTKQVAAGVIEFISPVDEADSGTIRVKVRIDNRDGRLRSGQRCVLQVDEDSSSSARQSILKHLPPVGLSLEERRKPLPLASTAAER